MNLILGVDTSNYTTSLAAIATDDGRLVGEARRLLPVKSGERGLRQSDALFFHVLQLPDVMGNLMGQLALAGEEVAWRGVGVSVRPRPLSHSYMPVFRAGVSFAETFAHSLRIPVIRVSHQEGHLAAVGQFVDLSKDEFFAVHLSGGTSDLLLAKRTRFGFRVFPIQESTDLHAGQFVDRVGVALGLPFPAGPHLEALAATQSDDSDFRLPGSPGGTLGFSGPCTAALRAVQSGVSGAAVAAAVQACIANSVVRAIQAALVKFPGVRQAVIAGGVASNQSIQQRVCHRLSILHPDLQVIFGPARFASDNAVGPAAIAHRFLAWKDDP